MNDYRPVALTPVVMKCFERLVMERIKAGLSADLDPYQFAYRPNRSTEDAISTMLHFTLSHLDKKNTYARILFIDFSSAFNTIIPQQLVEKLKDLNVDTGTCNWILDFLTQRSQTVKVGNITSEPVVVNTGSPQGCVLSPLLFTLLTHDCTARFKSNLIIKFADDTTVVGLITDDEEAAYREEVEQLAVWCKAHNLALNTEKTKEMIVDFRTRTRPPHPPVNIDGSAVERVTSTKFLGVLLTDNLAPSSNTTAIIKKAQQRLYPLRQLKKADLSITALTMFYRGTIESLLTYCLTSWYGNSTEEEKKQLNRTVRTAEKIVGTTLPSLADMYQQRCLRRATGILGDTTHPSHSLISLLPSGRRYRSIDGEDEEVFFPICN